MIVYINGEFVPLEQAKISVMDRGFLFGDSVYEVVAYFDKQFVCLVTHLERLQQSLRAINLTPPLSIDEWKAVLQALVEHNGSRCQKLYLQISRGPEPTRHHGLPLDAKPTVFAMTSPIEKPSMTELAKGIKAITLDDGRGNCGYIKSTNLLINILAIHQAEITGAKEALLVRDGYLVEGASSNVFVVKSGVIHTPPLTNYILGGTTRELILSLAKRFGLPLKEAAIPMANISQADEIWISSATRTVVPVVMLNDRHVGTGIAGPVWHQVIKYFFKIIRDGIDEHPSGEHPSGET